MTCSIATGSTGDRRRSARRRLPLRRGAHIGKSWNATNRRLPPTSAPPTTCSARCTIRGRSPRVAAQLGDGVPTRGRPLSESSPLRPPNPYGLSKLAMELLGQRTASNRLVVTIGRPFNHIGPRQDPVFAASGFAKQMAEIESGGATTNWWSAISTPAAKSRTFGYRSRLSGDSRARPVRPRIQRQLRPRGRRRRHPRDAVRPGERPIRVRVDPGRFRPNDVPLLVGD